MPKFGFLHPGTLICYTLILGSVFLYKLLSQAALAYFWTWFALGGFIGLLLLAYAKHHDR